MKILTLKFQYWDHDKYSFDKKYNIFTFALRNIVNGFHSKTCFDLALLDANKNFKIH